MPNPYQSAGGQLDDNGYNYQGQPNKLQFVNLPASAIIRIFTITGDLITRIDHTSGSGDESWDLMISDNNQFLVSGIYFAHIEDAANRCHTHRTLCRGQVKVSDHPCVIRDFRFLRR